MESSSVTIRLFRVFLASPGDLTEERGLARKVVDEFNELIGSTVGWRVDLLGWEDTLPGASRPQTLINEDVDRCELFVGILWRRWGSPPGGQGGYESGFEEEFSRASTNRKASGRPQIWQYFRQFPPELEQDAGPQLAKVIEFKTSLKNNKNVSYHEFLDSSQWRELFRRHLTTYILRLHEEAKHASPGLLIEHQSRSTDFPTSTESSSLPAWENGTAEADLRKAVGSALTAVTSYNEIPDRLAVARVHLMSAYLASRTFSSDLLDVHVANALYQGRHAIQLLFNELYFLIASSVARAANENVPLWYWFTMAPPDIFAGLWGILRSDSRTAVRSGTWVAMRLARISPWPSSYVRKSEIRNTLSDEHEADVTASILHYLECTSSNDEIYLIEPYLASDSYNIKNRAASAAIGIALRTSNSRALHIIIEHNLSPPSNIIAEIFREPIRLELPLLRRALKHRDKAMRAAAAQALANSQALSGDEVVALVADPEMQVRAVALHYQLQQGKTLTLDSISKLLDAQDGNAFLSLMSADFAPKTLSENVKMQVIREMDDEMVGAEVLLLAGDQHLFYRSFVERKFSVSKAEILADLSSDFETLRTRTWEHLLHYFGEENGGSIIARYTPALVKSVKSGFYISFIEAINRLGQRDQLSIVRDLLAYEDADVKSAALDFLRSYGDRTDVERVLTIAYNSRWTRGRSGLPLRVEAIRAALELSSYDSELVGRLDDQGELSAETLRLIPENYLAQMDLEVMKRLLMSNNSYVRRTFANRICLRSSHDEIVDLISTYSSGMHYYNVIFVLDCYAYCKYPLPSMLDAALYD